MCELVGGLMALGLMLTVVAAFGHALWLMAAAFFRALGGGGNDLAMLVPIRCTGCGRFVTPLHGRCPECSAALPTPPPALVAELEVTERQLRRLRDAGQLSSATYGDVVGVLRRDLMRATVIAREPVSASSPVAPQPASNVVLPETAPPERVAEQPEVLEAALVNNEAAREVTTAPEEILSAEAAVAPSGRPGSRALADLLRSFMEEKNIRWGELLSGLLIVGSAVGLVVSLWASLRDAIPYFPALIFLLVTAAIHGAGMYTLRRWKLKSTSRALLVISTLLIPLNFLAAIALSEQRPVTDPLYLTAVGTGLLAFGAMAFFAGRVLLLRGAWLLPVAVLGTSAGQLLATRLARPGMSHRELALLAALPVASYLVATCGQMILAARWRHVTQRRAGQVLLLLGVSVFALLMPLGLIVVKSAALWPTLGQLAPWISLAGFSIVGLGLVLQRRLSAPDVTALRTAATAVVLCGASAMILSLALAWPRAELLMAVGAIDFVVLSVLAVGGRFPALHIPAMEALALAILVGYHLATGNLASGGASGRDLLAVLLMGRSGAVLTAFAVLVMSAAGLLRRAGRPADALAYLAGAGGLAAASTLIALYSGFGSGVDREWATPLLGFWAAVVLTIAHSARRAPITWAGSALLLAACLHGLNLNPGDALAGRMELASRLSRGDFRAAPCHAHGTAGSGHSAWQAARITGRGRHRRRRCGWFQERRGCGQHPPRCDGLAAHRLDFAAGVLVGMHFRSRGVARAGRQGGDAGCSRGLRVLDGGVVAVVCGVAHEPGLARGVSLSGRVFSHADGGLRLPPPSLVERCRRSPALACAVGGAVALVGGLDRRAAGDPRLATPAGGVAERSARDRAGRAGGRGRGIHRALYTGGHAGDFGRVRCGLGSGLATGNVVPAGADLRIVPGVAGGDFCRACP